ncbi:hypothetical protein SAMN05421805_113164 [Saccharopolyspora antimicrobica]|uniref:Uncharacterized protein n=1 Tax=Saccharopolyspora antimicrobica TaxID=455193 RepID=A0A1I5GTP5_9PSEU|nr:hypothetical protein [Saccharopolyspora antimicrobica]RKT87375.1 hypothetical protein ATL45_5790 [Saccharopolyspora antimicrobica]SFO38951.1 hypothetical protein SAMN05421805_113164 [Saccharopolyspora antimicrobica]
MTEHEDVGLGLRATERALAAAERAGLGEWERTFPVNQRDDQKEKNHAVILWFGGPWVLIAVAIFVPMPWYIRVLLIVLAMGSVVGIAFATRRARLRGRSGGALVHLFASGLVLERTHGELVALPHPAPIEFVTWEEPGEDTSFTWVQLWVTLPEGRTVALEGATDAERETLRLIAQRCGLPPTPREVAQPDHPPVW